MARARSRFPMGAFGFLTLVVMVELAVAAVPLRFTDTASLGWRISFEAASQRSAAGTKIACLGDSLVKIGVLARVIEQTTGHPTHNYAMGRAPAPATYFLLRRLLESGQKLRLVVVDFKPSMLAGGPRFNLRQWQEVLRPGEAAELARRAGGVRFFLEIALGQVLPSYRDRWEIREAIVAALASRVAPTLRNNRLALRNWAANSGTHLNASRVPFDGRITPESRAKLIIPHWECHRANAFFVEQFLTLAESNGIPVVWVVPPSSPELQTLRGTEGKDAAYAAFIAAAQRRHPTLAVVDARFAGYETAVFADATHLNGRGASALSHELAQLLTHPGDLAARWVSLPLYREWPLAPDAEDIDRSAAIVDAALIRR